MNLDPGRMHQKFMPKSVNKAILLGRVGKDPEVKTSASGVVVAKFSLATNDRQKDKSGNWADAPTWHNLVAFNQTAEIVEQYVKKGTQLYVEGKITVSTYEKDGETRYRTSILVNEMVMVGSREQAEAPAPPARKSAKKQNNPEITDEDVPF